MRLLAVVVLYHPGKDLAGNIDSYLSQVDKLLLWDNTPGDGQERRLCRISVIRNAWSTGDAAGM